MVVQASSTSCKGRKSLVLAAAARAWVISSMNPADQPDALGGAARPRRRVARSGRRRRARPRSYLPPLRLRLWHEFAEPTIRRPASVPYPCGPSSSFRSVLQPASLMDKVRVFLPWAGLVCEPTLVVVRVSKALT